MKSHLMSLERKAREFRKAGRLAEAADIFAAIVKEHPDWEHGTAFYELACCHEDLGEPGLAEQYYREVLRYEPKSPIFLGCFASFLYLHGDPNKAFDAHLALLEIGRGNGDRRGIELTTIALKALGKKMGLSEETVADKIRVSQK